MAGRWYHGLEGAPTQLDRADTTDIHPYWAAAIACSTARRVNTRARCALYSSEP